MSSGLSFVYSPIERREARASNRPSLDPCNDNSCTYPKIRSRPPDVMRSRNVVNLHVRWVSSTEMERNSERRDEMDQRRETSEQLLRESLGRWAKISS